MAKKGLNNDWCKKMINRDGQKCQICGRMRKKRKKGDPIEKKVSLTIHHIKPQSLYPELRYCEENVITLCRECHNKTHCDDKHSVGLKIRGLEGEGK